MLAGTNQQATKRNMRINDANKNKEYLNQTDLQQLFGYGREKMHRFLTSGVLPTVKVGGKHYISREVFDRWMKNNAGKTINF